MPLGLKRYQQEGGDHFITFSCYRREPYFTTPASRDIFLDSLELTRKRYQFEVPGSVVMPEPVNFLFSKPAGGPDLNLTTKPGAPSSPRLLRLRWAFAQRANP